MTKAQWQRGIVASRRLGQWLREWEERARQFREGQVPEPRRRRRPPRGQ